MAKTKKPRAKARESKVTKKGTSAKRAAARVKAPPIAALVPGQYLLLPDPIEANADRPAIEMMVANTGDRPIQVGSHFHFFEVNRALSLDRKRAYGMRLDIPAGTAVRFEPGQTKKVSLIPLGGRREVWGLNGLVNGPLDGKKRLVR